MQEKKELTAEEVKREVELIAEIGEKFKELSQLQRVRVAKWVVDAFEIYLGE